MEVWKIIFLSKSVISRFHVNLPGCNLKILFVKIGLEVSESALSIRPISIGIHGSTETETFVSWNLAK